MLGITHPTLERARPLRRGGVVIARGARGLLRLCVLLVLLVVVLVAIITASARIGLPFLAAYKPSLEDRLSEYLESPVSIAELDTRWDGTGPVLRARGVQLTDPEGRQAHFDEFLIDVDLPRSILAGTPIMDELTLIGAKLAMTFDRDKGVGLNGINRTAALRGSNAGVETPVDAANPSEGGFNAIAWLLTASRVGMLDTQITLQLPDASTVVIENINIRVENDDDLHQVRMDLSLPPELGDQFEMGVDLSGDANDLSSSDGNFYIKAADFNASGIERIFDSYDINIPVLDALAERGTNAQLELWGELKSGNVQRLSGRTAVAQSQADDPAIDSLFGNLSWERQPEGGWLFAATDVVVGRQGAESVFDEIQIGSQQPRGLKPEWLALSTAETELKPLLDTITALAPSVMSSQAVDWIEHSSLSSKIRRADLRLSLPNPTDSFTLVAQLDDTEWLPIGRQPGARVPTLNVNIVNGLGDIQLPTQAISVLPPALPGVDAAVEPLMLNDVSWKAAVNVAEKTLEGDISVRHESLVADLKHTLTAGAQNAPTLNANGTFKASKVSDVKPWLVQGWMPEEAGLWLDEAIQGGAVSNGVVVVSGTLSELISPDAEGRGSSVMRAEFDAQNVTLDYLDDWPIATALNGKLVFEHTKLSAFVRSGSMNGLPIDKGTAVIENLIKPELNLSLTSATALSKLVEFCSTGPLREVLGPIMDGAIVNGAARLEFNLITPLSEEQFLSDVQSSSTEVDWPVTVRGNVFLTDSDVTLGSLEELPLSNVRGAIGFTEDGVELKTLQATLFGSKVRLNAASTGAGIERRTDVAVRTIMPGRKLLEQYELPGAAFVSGSSSWRADASIPHDEQRLARDGIALTVTGDMVGTRIGLAQPFGKGSNSVLPLRVSTRIKDSTGTKESPQIWRLTFGDRANPQTDVRLAVSDENGLEGMVMSLGESLGDRQPGVGIRVFGRADVLSLDGLVTDISTIIDEIPEEEGPPIPIMPISVDVYGPQMRAGNTRIGDVSIKVNTDDQFINFFINNAHLRGSLRYPREHWRKDIDIKARVNYADKVLIEALSSGDDPNEPVDRIDPRTLPPVEIHVNKFDWLPLQVSNLRVYAEPDVAGMRIRTFGFATGTTQLIGDGLWHVLDPQNVNPTLADVQMAQLHLTFQSSDFGQALSELGIPDVMADGEGRVTASLSWPDAIYAPDLEIMAGRAEIDIKRGQLLQIEPGAARLVGLFALQTLPRRFSFDFGDLVNDGLDFATITGDVSLDAGIAEMRLVQLNGPVGVVDITGTVDLVEEQFDQTVAVLPRVSAALPIIGIITGGASAGIGALIAGGVLKAAGMDFDRIGYREYSLTGDWENPKFEPL